MVMGGLILEVIWIVDGYLDSRVFRYLDTTQLIAVDGHWPLDKHIMLSLSK